MSVGGCLCAGVFGFGVSDVRPGSVSVPGVDVGRLQRPPALPVVLHAPRPPAHLQVCRPPPTRARCYIGLLRGAPVSVIVLFTNGVAR